MADIELDNVSHPLGTLAIEVRFDWYSLGEHFIRANSEDQAMFLLGWGAEADALGYLNEGTQYLYIAEAIPDRHIRVSIADRLRRLANFLDHEEGTP